ncbi:MAG: cation:proton antiporter [Culturomica sp.]|jgi:Kef-type K+ transport system membrane component KefB/nucleotide-binding universal stress UspA family protein|nr:cation:proton antiporter [Culturomica sp.]
MPPLLLAFPLKDPVLIFALILVIILLAPLLLHRLRIPELIVLILAGAIIGPNAFGILERDSSIELFGKVGLLYIMFIAGLEIDLADLKKNFLKSGYFGLLTFLLPMLIGYFTSFYILKFSISSSILLASLYASHTLITYPIVSRYGVARNRAVNISIGATIITCILSLLVLAVVVGMETGVVNNLFWWKLGISTAIFLLVVMWTFPIIARWILKRINDSITQYIFVLALVFAASFLADFAGLEDVIGAFFAGLALNRLIPNTSALMNRIEFVGNALFIPFFLIGVGMLVDYRIFTDGWEAIKVAIVMCVVAVGSKYIAAFITEKTLGYSRDEGRLLFGLSNSQAAATLAAVMVAYNVIIGHEADGSPLRLLNDEVLNGAVIMILVTCTISSFVTQKGARNVALAEITDENEEEDETDRILIPVSNTETVEELVNLGVTIKSAHSKGIMKVLSIIRSESNDPTAERRSQRLLDKAIKTASASDNKMEPLIRYDSEISNGIKNVVRQYKMTDVVLGLHKESEITDTFLGNLTENVLAKCATTTFVYRPVQPLSTIKRYLVVLPLNAEVEIGFPYLVERLWNLTQNTGSKIVFYGSKSMITILKEIRKRHSIDAEFVEFTNWHDFLTIISHDLRENDALAVVMSRRKYSSYFKSMMLIPKYMNEYYNGNNCLLIYPIQTGVGDDENENNFSLLGYYEESDLASEIGRLFKRR